jgi:hypothetical protein
LIRQYSFEISRTVRPKATRKINQQCAIETSPKAGFGWRASLMLIRTFATPVALYTVTRSIIFEMVIRRKGIRENERKTVGSAQKKNDPVTVKKDPHQFF